jgi:DNA-binding LacI/PurR family transcriptional regulator
LKEYEKVERLIIAEIENKHIQGFLPSERKLALRYSTSRINIKQAIKRLIGREIVYSASPRRLAISKPSEHTKKIAFVSFLKGDWQNIQSPIFRDSIKSAIENVPDAYECKYYGGTAEDEANVLKQLITEKVDGIISIPHSIGYYLNNIELYTELQKNDCKIVFMLRNIKEVISTSILPDEMFLIEEAVESLKAKGCEHIVMIERENSWMGKYRRNAFKFKYYKEENYHNIGSGDVDYDNHGNFDNVKSELKAKIKSLNIPKDKKVGFICLGGDQWILPLWDIFKTKNRNPFHIVSEGQRREFFLNQFADRNIPSDIFINNTINFKGHEMGKTAVDHLIALIESDAVYSNTIFIKPDINLNPNQGR